MKTEGEKKHQDRLETQVVHADRALNTTTSVAPPIYQTATFRASSAKEFAERASRSRDPEFYTRFGNPNLAQVEAVLAAIEGAEHVKKLYPVNVRVPKGDGGLLKDSVVLCNQIRTVDELRFGKVYGSFSNSTMEQIDRALRISLAL